MWRPAYISNNLLGIDKSKKCWAEVAEKIKQQGVYVPLLLYHVYITWHVYYFYRSKLVFVKFFWQQNPFELGM
jgi:hypothetical protein